jgi:hypothetical protein
MLAGLLRERLYNNGRAHKHVLFNPQSVYARVLRNARPVSTMPHDKKNEEVDVH